MKNDQNQESRDPRGVGWHRPPAPQSGQPDRSFWSGLWGGSGPISGEARGDVQFWRRDAFGRNVWTFRLQRHDDSGNELPVLQVEMRGNRLKAPIVDGDSVEVYGKVKPGKPVRTKRVMNLTTGLKVVD
jgi:hypothetical protein